MSEAYQNLNAWSAVWRCPDRLGSARLPRTIGTSSLAAGILILVTRRAMLAPQSQAIQTISLSTPASRSPQSWWSMKKASSSVSRVRAGIVEHRGGVREADQRNRPVTAFSGCGLVAVSPTSRRLSLASFAHEASQVVALASRRLTALVKS
jgi:hypothetical protein